LDAYPDLVLPGRIETIAAIGVTSGLSKKVRTFNTVFSIQGSDPRLLPDLSAAVDVELERLRDVLLLPRPAVAREDGKAFVNLRRSSGLEKRAIVIGPANDTEIVIESGLEAGDQVQPAPGMSENH